MENANKKIRHEFRFTELDVKELYGWKTPVPEVKIELHNTEDDSCSTIGYLMPFRGYCMQVTKTEDGQSTVESSGWNTTLYRYLYNYDDKILKDMIEMQILMVLESLTVRCERESDDVIVSNIMPLMKLDEFINHCVQWVKDNFQED